MVQGWRLGGQKQKHDLHVDTKCSKSVSQTLKAWTVGRRCPRVDVYWLSVASKQGEGWAGSYAFRANNGNSALRRNGVTEGRTLSVWTALSAVTPVCGAERWLWAGRRGGFTHTEKEKGSACWLCKRNPEQLRLQHIQRACALITHIVPLDRERPPMPSNGAGI